MSDLVIEALHEIEGDPIAYAVFRRLVLSALPHPDQRRLDLRAPAPKAEPAPAPERERVPAMSFKQFCQRNGITKGAIDSRRKEQKAGYPWPDTVKVGHRIFITFDAEKDYRVAAKVPLLAEPPVADIWL